MKKKYLLYIVFLCIFPLKGWAFQGVNISDTLFVHVEDIVNVNVVNLEGKEVRGTIMVFDKQKSMNISTPTIQFMIENINNTSFEIKKKGYKSYFMKFVVEKEIKYKYIDLKILLLRENEEGNSRIIKKKELICEPEELKKQ